MTATALRIAQLATETPYVLHVTWQDGTRTSHDLEPRVRETAWARPLRDPGVFRQACIADDGWRIIWPGTDIDLSAHGLWEEAHPRAEAARWMSAEAFVAWMRELGLSFAGAAALLEVSPRMLKYYASGTHAIPKTVWLACMHLASERARRAHPGKRSASAA